MTRRAGWVVALTGATLLGVVSTLRSTPSAGALDPGGWTMIAPSAVVVTGRLSHPRLAEASGAAVSAANPGLIWTIDDSGNPPNLLAIDSTGALRADLPLQGASNVDWEEVALGPCGAQRCVYIADTGDNAERRTESVIYRVVEPVLRGGSGIDSRVISGVESLRIRYPDHPHDVEAMAVTARGEILLVSKGRSGGMLLFRIGEEAWRSTQPALPTRIDSLAITPAGGMGREVTGMALSPDGTRLVVRTYRDLYPFVVGEAGRLTPLGKPTACDILGLEPQGEGIAFIGSHRLLLTSERGLFKSGTVITLGCDPATKQ